MSDVYEYYDGTNDRIVKKSVIKALSECEIALDKIHKLNEQISKTEKTMIPAKEVLCKALARLLSNIQDIHKEFPEIDIYGLKPYNDFISDYVYQDNVFDIKTHPIVNSCKYMTNDTSRITFELCDGYNYDSCAEYHIGIDSKMLYAPYSTDIDWYREICKKHIKANVNNKNIERARHIKELQAEINKLRQEMKDDKEG